MTLEISLVLKGMMYPTISGLIPFLETAAEYSRGRTTPDALITAFFNETYQLWIVHDSDLKFYGFFATELKTYPNKKMLAIQHCVIEPNMMAPVEAKMQVIADKFARDHGCHGIEFVGRPGWKRHAEKFGYRAQSVCYQKFFEVTDEPTT